MFDFLKKSKKKPTVEHYFGLILKGESGVGMLLKVDSVAKTVQKIDERQFNFTNGWELILEDVDEVLFELEKGRKVQADTILFFLYSHMIDQEQTSIKDHYVKKIAQIIKELELKGLGYVEYHEAIARYFESVEKKPFNCTIIEIDTAQISLCIYRGGVFYLSQTISKTQDLIEDLNELFKKVTEKDVLPSRIVLYDTSEEKEELSKVIHHKWSDSAFVQMPIVEVLTESRLEQILIHAVENQLFDKGTISEVDESDETAVQAVGFLVGEDVAQRDVADAIEPQTAYISAHDAADTPAAFQNDSFGGTTASRSSLVEKVRAVFGRFSTSMKTRWGVVAGLLLILCAVGAAVFIPLFFFHSAILVVYTDSDDISTSVRLSPKVSAKNVEGGLVILESTSTVEGEDSMATTGTKTVGQKARGSVSLFNSETRERSLQKGTILTSTKGVRFLLNEDVRVASASTSLTGDGNVLTVTGKGESTAEAEEIGVEGNIPSDEKLTVESFSQNQFFALSSGAFSGGTKEDLRTVARSDETALREKVEKKLSSETSGAKNNGALVPISTLTEFEVDDETFSHEVGEETGTLSLNMKGTIKTYSFSDKELKNELLESLQETVPDSFTLNRENVSYTIESARLDGDSVLMRVDATGTALLTIDKDTLYGDIRGVSKGDLEKVLEQKYKSNGYKLMVDSPLPFLRSRLPFFKDRIEVRTESL